MGPARAYLLPMMKPNTMNTRMMVPATATTAMMMTGFCSLETIAAGRRTETHGQTGREKHTNVRVNLCTSKDQDRRYIIEPALRVIAQPRFFFLFLLSYVRGIMRMRRGGGGTFSIFELSLYTRLYCFRKWA